MFDKCQLEKNEMEYLEVQIFCLFVFVISKEATKNRVEVSSSFPK